MSEIPQAAIDAVAEMLDNDNWSTGPDHLARAVLELAAPHLAEPYGVTLATLRGIATRATALPGGNDHARGYASAMRDVLAVLDLHGSPPETPVHLGATTTEGTTS